jgi:hypothetical protein
MRVRWLSAPAWLLLHRKSTAPNNTISEQDHFTVHQAQRRRQEVALQARGSTWGLTSAAARQYH